MRILATGLEVVDRARSAQGKGIRYALGLGGMKAEATHPGLHCDCSGFAAWCNRVSRHIEKWNPLYEGGDWFSTDTLVRDAKSAYGFVELVPARLARLGMLYVWPSPGAGRYGHVGIVSGLDSSGPVSVVHCSMGNDRTFGDAVHETGVEVFVRHSAIVARVAFIDY